MNAITFSDKDKSAEITVQELAQTMELGNSNGDMPAAIPMQPGELLIYIMEKVVRLTGLQPVERPIVIREQYCQTDRKAIKEGGSLKLEHYLIKRFVTKIQLPKTEFEGTENEMHPAIAVAYAYTDSIKGIEIAFGENVSVCENLCAYGKYHFSTFGNGKVSFEEGMQLLDYWLTNTIAIHKVYKDNIKKLMARLVSHDEYIRIVGKLFHNAVISNISAGATAPLNQSQVGALVQICSKYDFSDGKAITAWDILSAGTEVLKPHNSDMIRLLDDTTGFNDFILQEVGIALADPVIKEKPQS